jgi:hypothetical protein
MWCFLKDFAGPLATIIAATAAVLVTIFFNMRQTGIANSQKEIALDNLKHNVFEKRYEIYTAAKSLIEYAMHQSDLEKTDSAHIRELRVTLDEARFFFGSEVRAFLAEIDQAAEDLLQGVALKLQFDSPDHPRWSEAMDKLGSASRKLSAMYAELPEKFERALRYDQLTRDD